MNRILAVLLLAAVPFAHAADLLLVGNKNEDSVSLIDRATGRTLGKLPTGVGPHEIAVSGSTAVVTNYGRKGEGNSLTIIDLTRRQVAATMDLGAHSGPHGIEFFRDGRRAAVTAEGSGHLLIVDVPARQVLAAVPTGQEVSHMVALSPDEKRAYVANIGSGSLSVIDVDPPRLVQNIPTGAGAEGVAASPDGGEIWVSNRADNTVSIVHAGLLRVVATRETADFPIRVEMHDSAVLVSNAKSGELAVFDRKSRKELHRVKLVADESGMASRFFRQGGSTPIGVLSDGKRVYVALAGGDRVAVLDPGTWKVTGYWETGAEPDALALASAEYKAPPPSWIGMDIQDLMKTQPNSPKVVRNPDGSPSYMFVEGKCSRTAKVNGQGLVVSVYASGCGDD